MVENIEREIEDYKLLCQDKPSNLNVEVMKLLSEGYTLYGFPYTVASSKSTYKYNYQAMIKYKKQKGKRF